ncbi:MAG: hypothetical protein PUF72_10535 [Clostridiales bacterium]|nr:hypothetical protein [Clostridiales bacterium]
MKYLEPTMTIKTFAREKVVTVSGGGTIQGLEDYKTLTGASVANVSLNTLLSFNGEL